jgi:hypothetical protein
MCIIQQYHAISGSQNIIVSLEMLPKKVISGYLPNGSPIFSRPITSFASYTVTWVSIQIDAAPTGALFPGRARRSSCQRCRRARAGARHRAAGAAQRVVGQGARHREAGEPSEVQVLMSVRDTNAASHHHTPLHSNPPPNHTAMPPHHVPILLLLLHLLTGVSVVPAGAAAHSQPTHPLPARAAVPSATPPTVPALVQAVAPASRPPPPSSRPSLPRQTHPPTCAHPRRAALLPAGDLLQRSGPRLILLCIPAGAPSEAEGLEAATGSRRWKRVWRWEATSPRSWR